MDLWIRTQDRENLIKIDSIYMSEYNEGWAIKSGDTLGKYRTRERALQILDKIQKLIEGDEVVKTLNKTDGNMNNVYPIIFYEMPKE